MKQAPIDAILPLRGLFSMKVDVLPGRDLPRPLWEAWSELQQSNPFIESPFFRPEYMAAVASVRRDVFVAVINRGEAFFPFQKSWLGFGTPVGGLMTDYEGIISPLGVRYDVAELVAKCGLKAWAFNNVPAAQQSFGPWSKVKHPSYCVDLVSTLDFLSKRLLKGAERRLRRHEREVGPLRMEFNNRDPKMLDFLIKLKSQQFIRTGATHIFRHRWTRSLLSAIHRQDDPLFAGVLSVLWSRDDPIAVDFAIRSQGTMHQWIGAYRPDYGNLSPGTQLFLKVADIAPDHGITFIDISYGSEPYKLEITNSAIPLTKGFVSTGPAVARWSDFAWRAHRKFQGLCFDPRAGGIGRFLDRTYGSWLLR